MSSAQRSRPELGTKERLTGDGCLVPCPRTRVFLFRPLLPSSLLFLNIPTAFSIPSPHVLFPACGTEGFLHLSRGLPPGPIHELQESWEPLDVIPQTWQHVQLYMTLTAAATMFIRASRDFKTQKRKHLLGLGDGVKYSGLRRPGGSRQMRFSMEYLCLFPQKSKRLDCGQLLRTG